MTSVSNFNFIFKKMIVDIAALVEILSVEVVCEDKSDGPIKLDLKEVK